MMLLLFVCGVRVPFMTYMMNTKAFILHPLQQRTKVMVLQVQAKMYNLVFQKKGLMRSKFKKLKESREDGELTKIKVDKYLDEVIEGFDILTWWKNNSSRFLILSLVARDVLAIHVSTVASKSAFSTGDRVLDSFRSSLSSKMADALISCQDWLRASSPKVEECLKDIAQLEKELSKISLTPSVIDVP